MFDLIIDYEDRTKKREIKEHLTAKEMAEVITEYSKDYIMVFDMVTNVISAVGCTMWFTCIPRSYMN